MSYPALAVLLFAASVPTVIISTASAATADASKSFDELRAEINASPQAYGDPFYDQVRNTLHVTVAHPESLKGMRGVHPSRINNGEALGAQGAVSVEVDNVKYSHDDLKRVMDQISTVQPWASDVNALLATWGIDPKVDKVQVGLTRVTPAIAKEASTLFGDKVEIVARSRDKGAEKVTKLTSSPKIVKVAAGTR
ncbi:hypothetical protein [Amycolatopsis sp.]|uniref:hypothetical protein n=1 Tax=Amycolatopsis sp. TaxID=37632 RepID=UPI002629CCB1|nr:hypothetical protein [Amycolatopsis sp.]